MAPAQNGPCLEVYLGAIVRNYRLLKKTFSGPACAAVVKADAYGLGAVPISRALSEEGCETFFVATLEEALALKPHLENAKICVFHGVGKGEEKEFAAQGIIPVLNSVEQVERWLLSCRTGRGISQNNKATPQRVRGDMKLEAILHVDTGMCRLGLSMEEAENLAADAKTLAMCNIGLVMSHLACAGEPSHPMNGQQLARNQRLRQLFPELPFSLANSSGVFLPPEFHFDLARPGCALYGITPNPSLPNPVENVVELSAPILQIRTLERDMPVGYGATATVRKGSRIATLACGYADGMLRSLSNNASVHIDGLEAPVIGRISMDMTVVDVTHIPESRIKPGARAVMIGPDQSVDKVAAWAGTIGYEIFTRLGNRVAREYTGGE